MEPFQCSLTTQQNGCALIRLLKEHSAPRPLHPLAKYLRDGRMKLAPPIHGIIAPCERAMHEVMEHLLVN
jgi:hypothetical protein